MTALLSEPGKNKTRKSRKGQILHSSYLFTLLILIVLFGFTGCTNPLAPTMAFTETSTLPVPSIPPTSTHTLSPTPTITSTSTPTRADASFTEICSPLAGIELEKLHSITSQAFNPPTPFQDDGHPAVDLAFFTFEGLPSMMGHPVQAIFPGKVVLVVDDRFPYGSMILIETPLSSIPNELLPPTAIPTPIPSENIIQFNPCSNDPVYESMAPISMAQDSKSIYVLYSHLLEKPSFTAGDEVACGQVIGAVGLTGNTVAEHLHLEIRIGPSGANFGTIAMYKPDATLEERYNYCIWSTSGRFQPINPAIFWETSP